MIGHLLHVGRAIAGIAASVWICGVCLALNPDEASLRAASPSNPPSTPVSPEAQETTCMVIRTGDCHDALVDLVDSEGEVGSKGERQSADPPAPEAIASNSSEQASGSPPKNDYLPILVDLLREKPQQQATGSETEPIEVVVQDEEPLTELALQPFDCLVALSYLVESPEVAEVGSATATEDAQTVDTEAEPSEPVRNRSVLPILAEGDVVSSTAVPQQPQIVVRTEDSSVRVVQATEEIPEALVDAPDDDERPIGSITTDILPPLPEAGENVNLPSNEARKIFAAKERLPDATLARSEWMRSLYEWEASRLCHRPLYFEEISLERYGYSYCPLTQPLVSGARFFATVPILPYRMTAEPPREGTYTLGYYRPGSLAPYQCHWIPLRPKAGAVEAAAITGLIFAIP